MSDTITIKFKDVNGRISEFPVQELIEVDGVPYKSPEQLSGVENLVYHLEGRIVAIENMLRPRPETE